MSSLQDFLIANPVDDLTDEVVVLPWFKDKDGNLLKFKIKAMTNQSFDDLRKRYTRQLKKGRVEFDSTGFNNAVIMEHKIVPDFKDADSIQQLGCSTPEHYLNKVLLPGERCQRDGFGVLFFYVSMAYFFNSNSRRFCLLVD